MNRPQDLHSLNLCAQWHDGQAKIMRDMARNARADSNVKYCNDMAGTHERWADELRLAVKRAI